MASFREKNRLQKGVFARKAAFSQLHGRDVLVWAVFPVLLEIFRVEQGLPFGSSLLDNGLGHFSKTQEPERTVGQVAEFDQRVLVPDAFKAVLTNTLQWKLSRNIHGFTSLRSSFRKDLFIRAIQGPSHPFLDFPRYSLR